jgi:hypothetical protein
MGCERGQALARSRRVRRNGLRSKVHQAAPSAKAMVLLMLGVFATAFAPLLGEDQRNYLVIAVATLAFPVIFFSGIRLGRDFSWTSIAIVYPVVLTIQIGGESSISTMSYTGMLALSYIAFASALVQSSIARHQTASFLRRLIYAYAIVSVVQMIASLMGLPAPNTILSKGLWSYNSLAPEPSQAARLLSATMLAYLMLVSPRGQAPGLISILLRARLPLLAFCISMILTGSALAVLAMPLTVMLSLRLRWMLTASIVALVAWPLLHLLQIEAVQRSLALMSALPSMDIATISDAENSGGLRIIPFLIYLQGLNLDSASAWFGEGLGGIRVLLLGKLPGAATSAGAGFIPGYMIAFGLIGTALFVAAFIGRFTTSSTLPYVLMWMMFFTSSAWNTQIFWYSLMLLRILHHHLLASPVPKKRPKRASARRMNPSPAIVRPVPL